MNEYFVEIKTEVCSASMIKVRYHTFSNYVICEHDAVKKKHLRTRSIIREKLIIFEIVASVHYNYSVLCNYYETLLQVSHRIIELIQHFIFHTSLQ